MNNNNIWDELVDLEDKVSLILGKKRLLNNSNSITNNYTQQPPEETELITSKSQEDTMNINDFLDIYEHIAKEDATEAEVDILYDSLAAITKDTDLENNFISKSASRLDKVIAIDDIAHKFHSKEPGLLKTLFPDANPTEVKSRLDTLAGMESSNEVRKYNRNFFTTLLSEDGLDFLMKQVGKTTKDDISEALKEYENLYDTQMNSDEDSKILSDAELLTLYRATKQPKYLKLMKQRGVSDTNEPMVIGGYASVEMIDKEGHLITTEALDKAFDSFMKSFRTRNINFQHSDAQVGWNLPAWMNKAGEVFKSGVDDKGLYVVSEIRNDSKIADRVKKAIEAGEIKSYSIAGQATDKQVVTKGNKTYLQVDALELMEVTLCLVGDTKIWTKSGLREIKDIKIGDLVLTHTHRYQPVINVMSREIDENIMKITTPQGSLLITKEHPVRVVNIKKALVWQPAGSIRSGDMINYSIPNKYTFPTSMFAVVMGAEEVPYKGSVYNLEVADDNSYVTEIITCHNCEKPVNQDSHFTIIKSLDLKSAVPDDDLIGNYTQKSKDEINNISDTLEGSGGNLELDMELLEDLRKADDIKVSTKAIIKNPDNKILIIKDKYSDYWDLPGGHVQDGETIADGLCREVQDESGIDLDDITEYTTRELTLGKETKPVIFFISVLEDTPEVNLSEEHTDHEWIDPEEIENFNLGVFKDILNEYLEKGMSEIPIDMDSVDSDNIDKEILRTGIIAEQDAVNLYEQMAANTNNDDLKTLLLDVAREEKTHIGEFEAVLRDLDTEFSEELDNGAKEVEDILGNSDELEMMEKGQEVQEKILEFFSNNPDPSDDEVHNFAAKLDMKPDDFEEEIYKVLSDLASDENDNKDNIKILNQFKNKMIEKRLSKDVMSGAGDLDDIDEFKKRKEAITTSPKISISGAPEDRVRSAIADSLDTFNSWLKNKAEDISESIYDFSPSYRPTALTKSLNAFNDWLFEQDLPPRSGLVFDKNKHRWINPHKENMPHLSPTEQVEFSKIVEQARKEQHMRNPNGFTKGDKNNIIKLSKSESLSKEIIMEEIKKASPRLQTKLVSLMDEIPLEKTIRKVGNKYQLVARSTGKVLGTHPSKEAAMKQEAAIKISQHKSLDLAKQENLIPKKVTVHRGGKTFERTQMVQPSNLAKQGNLVPKKVTVHRGGKTFERTQMVQPSSIKETASRRGQEKEFPGEDIDTKIHTRMASMLTPKMARYLRAHPDIDEVSQEDVDKWENKALDNLNEYLEKQRFGRPLTDEERAERHKARFGTEELPPRGTGRLLEKQVREPFAVATAICEKMGITDFSEGSPGRKKRDEIAEAIKEDMKSEDVEKGGPGSGRKSGSGQTWGQHFAEHGESTASRLAHEANQEAYKRQQREAKKTANVPLSQERPELFDKRKFSQHAGKTYGEFYGTKSLDDLNTYLSDSDAYMAAFKEKLNEHLEKQVGMIPPYPGLVFDRNKHRWVRPVELEQEAKAPKGSKIEAEPKSGRPKELEKPKFEDNIIETMRKKVVSNGVISEKGNYIKERGGYRLIYYPKSNKLTISDTIWGYPQYIYDGFSFTKKNIGGKIRPLTRKTFIVNANDILNDPFAPDASMSKDIVACTELKKKAFDEYLEKQRFGRLKHLS